MTHTIWFFPPKIILVVPTPTRRHILSPRNVSIFRFWGVSYYGVTFQRFAIFSPGEGRRHFYTYAQAIEKSLSWKVVKLQLVALGSNYELKLLEG
jgi:hypothetical protein